MTDARLSEGDLVKVATAQNEAEAELLQNLLRDAGVPSTLVRTRGFDVPDFLAAGPRDVLVPAGGAQAAREMLFGTAHVEPPPRTQAPRAERLVGVGLLIGLALVACFAWVGTELVV